MKEIFVKIKEIKEGIKSGIKEKKSKIINEILRKCSKQGRKQKLNEKVAFLNNRKGTELKLKKN